MEICFAFAIFYLELPVVCLIKSFQNPFFPGKSTEFIFVMI